MTRIDTRDEELESEVAGALREPLSESSPVTASAPGSVADGDGGVPSSSDEPSVERRSGWRTGIPEAAPEGWERPGPTRRDVRFDVWLGIATTATMALNVWAATAALGNLDVLPSQPAVAFIVIPVGFGAFMAMRRLAPITALALATVWYVATIASAFPEVIIRDIAYFVIFFSAGAWSPRRRTVMWLRLAIAAGMIAWSVGTVVVNSEILSAEPVQGAMLSPASAVTLITFIANALFFGVGFVLGNRAYLEAAHTALIAENAKRIQAQREQLAEQAVRLDRVRIARELHDAVAHHVSLMGLQAAVARRSLPNTPESNAAREQLEHVEASAREAIEELHSIVATLRDEPGGDDTADPGSLEHDSESGASTSAPSTLGIDQVEPLVQQVREAGLTVDYAVIGDVKPLSPAAELTVYRTVQEALTNVRKHAGANARADVRIRFTGEVVEVDITDDGTKVVNPRQASGGRGLRGMAERAAAVGGSVQCGPRAEGGFRVRLTLPVAEARSDGDRA